MADRKRRSLLPSLGDLARRASSSPPPPEAITTPGLTGPRTTFQRRPTRARRGPPQPVLGLSPAELRAAQDVEAPLANRIVIKELRRRRVAFEFAVEGEPVVVSGLNVDFLVSDRSPLLVIDIVTPQRPDDGWRRAVLTAAGYRYEAIEADTVLLGQRETEDAIEKALGQLVGTADRVIPPDPRQLRAPVLPFGNRIWSGGDLDYDDVLDYDDEVEVVP